MIHLKVLIDQRRSKKDGTHPIVFRITLKGKTRDISTGFACKKKEWSTKNKYLKSSTDNADLFNQRIRDQEVKLLDKIREYEINFPDNKSIQDVREHLKDSNNKDISVYDFWIQEINRLNDSKHFGNARNYQSALSGLVCVCNLKTSFDKIDYKWLVDTETKLKAKGLKVNSISIYYRKLRSIYNRAVNYGVAEANHYPFRRYVIKSEATNPRVINIVELNRFFSATYKERRMIDTLNYGRLIFMLRGINFADLAVLTNDNIKNGRLLFKRTKTHKMYSVELLPEVKQILGSYSTSDRITLLPILSNEEYEDIPKRLNRIRQKRKTCNKYLKRIGKSLGIDENLTTYVFRYSHANACKDLGYSKDIISESLGHGYGLAVSSAYLNNYNIELIDSMNETVCKKVIGG